uniref:Uncharacterized protein n=1 Tax=Ciona savignyi TaxID=51511 RepID=H2YGH3_CIOSA
MEKGEIKETKIWRGSLLLNFGDGVGISLEKLGREYDEMIKTFEEQKQRLREFVPQEEAIKEEACSSGTSRNNSPTPSNTSSKKMKRRSSTSTFQSSLRSAQASLRKKLTNKSHLQKSPLVDRKPTGSSTESKLDSDTCSLDSDVFVIERRNTSEDTNHNNSTELYDERTKKTTLNVPGSDSRPPISPNRDRSATLSHTHVLSPPVLVDGEVRKDFQYLSPSHTARFNTMDSDQRNKRLFRSGSFAKLIGKTDCAGITKKHNKSEDSPLKALYRATVQNTAENLNNNNYQTKDIIMHG